MSKLELALCAVLVLCIARLWIMPLPSSLWVDEMATFFVVQHGAADTSLQVAPQVPASIYYTLARAAVSLFGPTEIAVRIPSLIALALSLFLIAWLAARFIHPQAGWFAVFACMAIHGFNYEAGDARPYALGTLLVLAAICFLVRWLDTARWLDAAFFLLTASLVWRTQLVFWAVYPLFGIYAVAVWRRRQTRVPPARILLIFAILAVSLVPVLLGAMPILRGAHAHVVAAKPSLTDLLRGLRLASITACVAALSLVSRWRRWPVIADLPSATGLTLVLSFWLCAPLGLFAFSWITGQSIFLPRYLAVSLPGAGLAATVAAAVYIPARYWKPFALAVGIGSLLFLGNWNRLWPQHQNSNWRSAAQWLSQQKLGAGAPVIAPSPFVEARTPVWHPDYPLDSFLYSHLAVYRIPGKIVPLPFQPSLEAEAFSAHLSAGRLPASDKFAIYGGDRAVQFWTAWFRARPELAKFQTRSASFGDVEVSVFEKSH